MGKVGPAFNKREKEIDQWMRMMVAWGDNVRKNIVHIEDQLKHCCPDYEPYKKRLVEFQSPGGKRKSAKTVYKQKRT